MVVVTEAKQEIISFKSPWFCLFLPYLWILSSTMGCIEQGYFVKFI